MSDDWKDPRWQKLRLAVFERDGWKCVGCHGSTNTLNVHHISYSGRAWETPMCDLQTLCERCHHDLGKHPKGGVYYERSKDIEAGDILAVSYRHCPMCGCKTSDCHSGSVMFTCGCYSKYEGYCRAPSWCYESKKVGMFYQGIVRPGGDESYVFTIDEGAL